MSIEAREAVWAVANKLEPLLAELPVKRRPSRFRALAVALRLADKHRTGRGYVDETVDQLRAVLAIDPRIELAALDTIGVWTVESRGTRTRGSRRVPGPILVPHLGTPDRAEMGSVDNPISAGLPRSDEDSSRRGSNPISAGYDLHLGGVTPRLPDPDPFPEKNSLHPRDGSPLARHPAWGIEEAHEAEEPKAIGEAIGRVLNEAARKVGATREVNGFGKAGPGALAKNRKELGQHRGLAERWLGEGCDEHDIARSLASRVTDGGHSLPRGATPPPRCECGDCDDGLIRVHDDGGGTWLEFCPNREAS